jgi:hypothetical protein
MATSVFYPSSNGFVVSIAGNYSNARAGTDYKEFHAHHGDNVLYAQQLLDGGNYILLQALLRFDTSAIGSDTVTAATLSLYPQDKTGSPGDLEVYPAAFGASLGTEDWVPGVSLSGLLASITYAAFTTGAYRDLASTIDFKSAINGSGNTDLVLATAKFRAGTAPTGMDVYVFSSREASSSYRPKLTVEHSAAPSGLSIPVAMHHYCTLRR